MNQPSSFNAPRARRWSLPAVDPSKTARTCLGSEGPADGLALQHHVSRHLEPPADSYSWRIPCCVEETESPADKRRLRPPEPKTRNARRAVMPTASVKTALRKHRANQAAERLLVGPAWQDMNLVFPNSSGGPLESSFLVRGRFYPLLAKAGLLRIRFHDLRHTAATSSSQRQSTPKSSRRCSVTRTSTSLSTSTATSLQRCSEKRL